MSAVRFRVWPGVDAEYYAYYLAGLGETFGPTSLRFSAAGFPELSQRHLLFVDEATGLRVCIDAFDDAGLSQPALAWCDVYGKVNLLADAVPADARSKVVPLGPSFPIRLWAPPAALWHAGETWLRARRRSWSSALHVAPWRRQ